MKLINHRIKLKKHIINISENINKKIILISDIHYSHKFKKEKIDILIQKIKNIQPDFICITGDIIDNIKIIEEEKLKNEILHFLTMLSQIAKVIVSIGNHDQFELIKSGFRCKYRFNDNKKWFEEVKKIDNLHLLDNSIFEIDNICFIGFTPSFNYYENEVVLNNNIIINELNSNLPQIDDKKFNILLTHSPINILNENTYKETPIKKMNLILAGHTHNGMVPPIIDELIPNNYGIFSPNNHWFYNAKLTRGRFILHNINLIISGGITKIHECSPKYMIPLNELFPMSIDFIEIVGNKKVI